jgi:hypothetical protein
MKKILKFILITVGSLIGLFAILVIIDYNFGGGHEKALPPVKHKAVFQNSNISKFPGKLSTRENKIVDSSGKAIMLKGLMAPDPRKLDLEGKFNEEYYKEVFSQGGNIIRVPVHPDRWEKDQDYFWRYLDPVVAWGGENNHYVVIDLHFIGNIATGAGDEMPELKQKPKEFAINFWRQTAQYFKDAPNVIFEICNEPAKISSEEWYSTAEELVKVIRETGAEQLIIVGGIDYSYDLSWVGKTPIKDNNVAYAAHVYPVKEKWDYYFGEVSKKYPVIVTEWGFIDENRYITKQKYLIGDKDSFGEPFLKYLEERNIGWIACWYDDGWEPEMFTKDFKALTNYGKFVLSKLK